FFFFFQAEDGIRVFHVTGVQTCALPISWRSSSGTGDGGRGRVERRGDGAPPRPVRPPGPRGGVPGGPAPERRLHRAAGVHAPDIRPARGRRTGPSPLRDGLSPTSLSSEIGR